MKNYNLFCFSNLVEINPRAGDFCNVLESFSRSLVWIAFTLLLLHHLLVSSSSYSSRVEAGFFTVRLAQLAKKQNETNQWNECRWKIAYFSAYFSFFAQALFCSLFFFFLTCCFLLQFRMWVKHGVCFCYPLRILLLAFNIASRFFLRTFIYTEHKKKKILTSSKIFDDEKQQPSPSESKYKYEFVEIIAPRFAFLLRIVFLCWTVLVALVDDEEVANVDNKLERFFF